MFPFHLLFPWQFICWRVIHLEEFNSVCLSLKWCVKFNIFVRLLISLYHKGNGVIFVESIGLFFTPRKYKRNNLNDLDHHILLDFVIFFFSISFSPHILKDRIHILSFENFVMCLEYKKKIIKMKSKCYCPGIFLKTVI